MKKLLHIIATPRQEESRTLKVTEAFLKDWKIMTLIAGWIPWMSQRKSSRQ
jgi:hypothetical protein